MKNKGLKLILLATALLLSGCGNPTSSEEISSESSNEVSSEVSSEQSSEEISSEQSSEQISSESSSEENPDNEYDNYVSIAEALKIAEEAGSNGTSKKYTVIGKIKNIKSTQYGDMTITDGTDELFIYGPRGIDGETYFDQLEDQPKVGDTVVLYGTLKDHEGTMEMEHPAILSFEKGEDDGGNDSNFPQSGEVTISQAIEIAMNAGTTATTGKYILKGTIKKIDNSEWGNMYITDGTKDFLIYGLYDTNGNRYDVMSNQPTTGDEITVEGHLMAFNGDTPQMKDATLKAFDVSFDESQYTQKSVLEARQATDGTKVKVTGVVAQITKANGFVNDGFYVVDGTNSIYVYGIDTAGGVEVGNTVTVCGTKELYIAENESSNASKYGYKGCNQIADARVTSNDKKTTGVWDNSWVEEKTVKEIMETSASEDITTTIYKVTALVKKVVPESNDFVNYYINDLDGFTGSYVYTKNNGKDYSYLDQYDGKICTVYVSVINAKSSSSGCLWRFVPIALEENNDFKFDMSKAPQFAYDYYLEDKISSTYSVVNDANVELPLTSSNSLLDFTANYSYSSSNEDVVYFDISTPGAAVLHTGVEGTATVTITVSVDGQPTYEKEITVTVEAEKKYDTISIADAVASTNGTEVLVKGVVVSSLVNQTGFYLQDETGIIAVTCSSSDVASVQPGEEVVISGIRGEKHKNNSTTCTKAGQINIYNAVVVENYHGSNSYSSDDFITDKTVDDIYSLSVNSGNETTKVYVVKGIIKFEELKNGTYVSKVAKLYNEDGTVAISLYSSSSADYKQFESITDQVATVEVAITNWNCKSYYTGCIISAQIEGGEKIINTLNFAK